MKTILFLGAAHFQLSAIRYAINKNYRVYTCDNQPKNPGHKLAHKSFNISTTNVDEILKKLKHEQIDGIITSGSDISALTVSKVAEKLNLPCNPSSVINIMTNKSLFRNFLEKNNFQKNKYICLNKKNTNKIKELISFDKGPWIMKPNDSSGSKGIFLLNSFKDINLKIEQSMAFSMSKLLIIEKFQQKKGPQICGDGFFKEGNIQYIAFGDGWYYSDNECFAPYAETFPSSLSKKNLIKLKNTIEKILQRIGFIEGAFNHDSLILEDDTPFILEIGPRSGGNYIPEAIDLMYGFNSSMASVESCLGNKYSIEKSYPNTYPGVASYMIHSIKDGYFNKISFNKAMDKKIKSFNIYPLKGDFVKKFTNGSHSIGNCILKFDSKKEMIDMMKDHKNFYKIFIS